MNLVITSIRRVTTITPETLFVQVAERNDTDAGHTDVSFEVEIKNIDFMAMSLTEIESLAISRAEDVIKK